MRQLRAWIAEIGRRISEVLDAADRKAVRISAFAKVAGAVSALALLLFLAAGPATLAAPRTCASCHSAAYAKWQASPHAKVGCGSCHTDRAAALGLGNSVGLLGDVTHTGAGSNVLPVPNTGCLRCHPSAKLDATVLTSSGLRMSHRGLLAAGYRCVDCHADVAHSVPAARSTRPTMSRCATCHNNEKVTGACTTCHAEAASKVQARQVDPEWSKTHGPDWKTLHGMGDLSTCTLCHARADCQKCHGLPMPHDDAFVADHGTVAKQGVQVCLACHQQSFCDSCHGIQMPHPAGFLAAHPTVAKEPNAPCLRCHTQANCDDCHQAHVHPYGLTKK